MVGSQSVSHHSIQYRLCMKSRRQVGRPASTWARSSLTFTASRDAGRRSQTPPSGANGRRHPWHSVSAPSGPTSLPQSGQRTRGGSACPIDDLLIHLEHAAHGHVPAEIPIHALRGGGAESREERAV